MAACISWSTSASLPGGSATATGPIETVNEDDLISDFDVKYVGALRCARAAIPYLKEQGWGRIINISGGNARVAGNLSGGARNVSMVHMTKTLSNQLGRFGITVNCIHPGTTRTERTAVMLAERAAQMGITPEEVEAGDFAAGSPRGNAICRMVDAFGDRVPDRVLVLGAGPIDHRRTYLGQRRRGQLRLLLTRDRRVRLKRSDLPRETDKSLIGAPRPDEGQPHRHPVHLCQRED